MLPFVESAIRLSARPVSGACASGTKMFEKLRAVTDPVTRRVRCNVPRTAFAVRRYAAGDGFACDDDRAYHPAPASARTVGSATHQRRRDGSGGGTASRAARCGAGAAEEFEDGDMSYRHCNRIWDKGIRDVAQSALVQWEVSTPCPLTRYRNWNPVPWPGSHPPPPPRTWRPSASTPSAERAPSPSSARRWASSLRKSASSSGWSS